MLSVDLIAQVAHEANRAYCQTQGDFSQVPWSEAPDWQKASSVNGVLGIAERRITSPEQSHESWLAEKVADGWTYGPEKNPALKQHPCLVPFAELSELHRVKDSLFFAVVTALLREWGGGIS